MESYRKLCSDFYDPDKPSAPLDEIEFYASAIAQAGGAALEAMCGSGRLLIPLLQGGLAVSGVDTSHDMLQNLTNRCDQAGVAAPAIFQQSLVDMELHRRFQVAFIAIGSF